jgi:glycosyltransferase involved in cell wall biosynthesis
MAKKVLYLTRLDPSNYQSWSGTTYFIYKALKNNFKITTVGPLSNRIRYFFLIKKYFYSLFKIKFDIDRPILVAKDFAKQIQLNLMINHYDAIITSEPYLVTFLETKIPIYIYTDFLFSTYYSNYFFNKKIHNSTIKEGNYCEKIALKKSKKIILTSEYAINEASKNYKIKKNKFSKIPFGANLIKIPDMLTFKKKLLKKNFAVCNLISVGVHWNRKGMEKACRLVDKINLRGQKAKLYIIGAKPPWSTKISNNVILIDFLKKDSFKDQKFFNDLMYNSHFHILFSESEAFGIANVEASAYGLYNITHDIGGIEGAVTNNLNGFRFPTNRSIDFIAEHIISIFSNKRIFIKNSIKIRNFYEKNLSWDIISLKLKKIIT